MLLDALRHCAKHNGFKEPTTKLLPLYQALAARAGDSRVALEVRGRVPLISSQLGHALPNPPMPTARKSMNTCASSHRQKT
jgi:hypothetical protein